jgi:DNA-binding response OmpR family regulator
MAEEKQDYLPRLLIVDDEPVLRKSMSLVFAELGYRVRCAEDGFSALAEIRNEIPDVIISDLHMPRMSGYELLSLVRQRFPAIRTIAMSGAFWGDETPAGVTADAYYPKGSGFTILLRILRALPRTERNACELQDGLTSALVGHSERDSAEDAKTGLVVCQGCQRTNPLTVRGSIRSMNETGCIFCGSSIPYALAQPKDWTSEQAPRDSQCTSSGAGLSQFTY